MRLTESTTVAFGPGRKTRDIILNTAVELFGARGFDAVSVRDITAAAAVNGASIGYHFGTKEELIREAFVAVIAPINDERLRRLDALLAECKSGQPDLAAVIDALILPVIASTRRRSRSPGSYHRFLVLAYALRRPFVDEFMREENDRVALRFVEAFARAKPDVGVAEIWWRYDFLIGSLVHILLDADRGGRLRSLSRGLCDTRDTDSLCDKLKAFAMAGFAAPSAAPAKPPRAAPAR